MLTSRQLKSLRLAALIALKSAVGLSLREISALVRADVRVPQNGKVVVNAWDRSKGRRIKVTLVGKPAQQLERYFELGEGQPDSAPLFRGRRPGSALSAPAIMRALNSDRPRSPLAPLPSAAKALTPARVRRLFQPDGKRFTEAEVMGILIYIRHKWLAHQ